ncbi:MAG: PQQ-binding-like beta-propeller repeat protein [Phycisphaerales bacterium]|nr:PQQ-binding-like beta-propeller repeat protein [Phycisphaerales bacterium]
MAGETRRGIIPICIEGAGGAEIPGCFALSSAGEFAAIGFGSRLHQFDCSTGANVRGYENDQVWKGCMFSPTSDVLVGLTAAGRVYAWDARTGERRWESSVADGPGPGDVYATVRISPDGAFAAVGLHGRTYTLDMKTGRVVASTAGTLREGGDKGHDRVWLDDQVVVRGDGEIRLVDPRSGGVVWRAAVDTRDLFCIGASPQTRWIAGASGGPKSPNRVSLWRVDLDAVDMK